MLVFTSTIVTRQHCSVQKLTITDHRRRVGQNWTTAAMVTANVLYIRHYLQASLPLYKKIFRTFFRTFSQ